ncbi:MULTISPECIES: hypothetical protein [Xanthomonas]|nr:MULTISPECIES: hypothetical protein [Xanthomonas]MBE0316539.1 hypothetical protein [Xanthomonas citri pv. punicae]MDS0759155.1 hypothetical protein [Xanthomonas citri pv. punicae]MDS0762932.1 hypothetical protein [Xanthomonas citri pv. punicae]MDS0797701.1 hypothetical protein [Xanthomonas citri pv. punicae]MDS0830336.1 hypothetical protein [Xanthomonas citri pv. punicae]
MTPVQAEQHNRISEAIFVKLIAQGLGQPGRAVNANEAAQAARDAADTFVKHTSHSSIKSPVKTPLA